jgi:hypothetical protein
VIGAGSTGLIVEDDGVATGTVSFGPDDTEGLDAEPFSSHAHTKYPATPRRTADTRPPRITLPRVLERKLAVPPSAVGTGGGCGSRLLGTSATLTPP